MISVDTISELTQKSIRSPSWFYPSAPQYLLEHCKSVYSSNLWLFCRHSASKTVQNCHIVAHIHLYFFLWQLLEWKTIDWCNRESSTSRNRGTWAWLLSEADLQTTLWTLFVNVEWQSANSNCINVWVNHWLES